jgi:hypothetical protein
LAGLKLLDKLFFPATAANDASLKDLVGLKQSEKRNLAAAR